MLTDTGAIAFETRPADRTGLTDELVSCRRPRSVSISVPEGSSGHGVRLIVERFEALKALTDDWDGYGSPAPAVDTLIDALNVLRRFMPGSVAVPAVAPTTVGGIQFEWHRGGWDIEVEVTPSGHAIAWGENLSTGESFHGTIDEAREDLVETLNRVAADYVSRKV